MCSELKQAIVFDIVPSLLPRVCPSQTHGCESGQMRMVFRIGDNGFHGMAQQDVRGELDCMRGRCRVGLCNHPLEKFLGVLSGFDDFPHDGGVVREMFFYADLVKIRAMAFSPDHRECGSVALRAHLVVEQQVGARNMPTPMATYRAVVEVVMLDGPRGRCWR